MRVPLPPQALRGRVSAIFRGVWLGTWFPSSACHDTPAARPLYVFLTGFFILEATPSPTSPANQQAGYVHRLDAGVVIRSVESFGASNLRASEASFEAFGGLLGVSWGSFGGPWGSEAHFDAYILNTMEVAFWRRRFWAPRTAPRGPQMDTKRTPNTTKMVAKKGRRRPSNGKPRKHQT